MADNFTATPVKGLLTNNTAAPSNTNVGALIGIANAAVQTWTEGNQVGASFDLSGNLRVTIPNSTIVSENLAQVNGVTVLTGAGATGTGSQRTTVAQDTTTIAGSAPGTAGTPSANVITVQGTTSGTALNVKDTSDGSVSPGTAGTTSTLAGGVYISAGVTLTTGQQTALQLDSSGNLKVTLSADTINVNTNLAQVNGVTVLAGAGATGTGSQRITVAQDTTTIAGSAPGTAGTPSTNVVSVQGVASGTNIPVSQATAANLNATVVQGATAWVDNITQVAGTAVTANAGATGAGTLRVTLGTGTGLGAALTTPLAVEFSDGTNQLGTATNPIYTSNTSTSGTPKLYQGNTTGGIAAGASNTFTTPAVTTAKTGYLEQVTLSSSVRWKAQIGTYNGTTFTIAAIVFGEAFRTERWIPGLTSNVTQTGGAGDVFQVIMSNEDNNATADLYTTIEWTER